MLNRIWIDEQNWQGYCLKEADFLNLKKLNFFIGVNNSGKSRFVRQVLVEHTEHYVLSDGYSDLDDYEEDIELLTAANQRYSGFAAEMPDNLMEILNKKTLHMEEWKYLSQLSSVLESILIREKKSYYKNYHDALVSFENFERKNQRKIFANIKVPEFPERYYIPVLRGLRPITPNKDTYKSRTAKDYFDCNDKINIVTGHELYDLLVKYLLGLPENRARVRAYEKKLGDVFFEGKEVVLIPEHGKDTVAVKIGDEPQLPIYDLGDGLQQVIIITSHAFLNAETSLYCVEEPEVHMHPGLLRRLAVFLADETPHQYLMTTHSNHLFDLADDRHDVVIHKVKKTLTDEQATFEISEVSKDKTLLLELGVKPSSVYLSNCTVWVEGVTDRLYIRAFLKRYLALLEKEEPQLHARYSHYNENYHYAFVEYQGGVLTHWNFDEHDPDHDSIAGLSALSVCSEALLIADGDIRAKANRVELLEQQLDDRLMIIEAKEIENYLPAAIIQKTVRAQFSRKKRNTDKVDVGRIDELKTEGYCGDLTNGIGRVIDKTLLVDETKPLFSESSGTIKDKVNFCLTTVDVMNSTDWDMPDYLKKFCKNVFKHIDANNGL